MRIHILYGKALAAWFTACTAFWHLTLLLFGWLFFYIRNPTDFSLSGQFLQWWVATGAIIAVLVALTVVHRVAVERASLDETVFASQLESCADKGWFWFWRSNLVTYVMFCAWNDLILPMVGIDPKDPIPKG